MPTPSPTQASCQISLLEDSHFVGESRSVFLIEARRQPQVISLGAVHPFLLNDLLLVSRHPCAWLVHTWMRVLWCMYGGQRVQRQLYEVIEVLGLNSGHEVYTAIPFTC